MKICCCQLDVVFGQPLQNIERAIDCMVRAKEQGADLIVFPECFLTGYCVSTREDALKIAINPQILFPIEQTANELDIVVIIGFAELDGETLYNSAALIEPGVETRIYRKSHLPILGFDRFATAGTSLPVFQTRLGKIGILVCFDLRPPEPTRCMALEGAEIVILPTNWPDGAQAGPCWIAPARAAENRIFMATCNRVGHENGFDFIGQSGIYNVLGQELAKAGQEPTFLFAEVNLAEARFKRNVVRPGEYETTIFESRQPKLYSKIVE